MNNHIIVKVWAIKIKKMYSGPRQILTFWAIEEFLQSGPLQKVSILYNSRISTFWITPEFVCSVPLKNF